MKKYIFRTSQIISFVFITILSLIAGLFVGIILGINDMVGLWKDRESGWEYIVYNFTGLSNLKIKNWLKSLS